LQRDSQIVVRQSSHFQVQPLHAGPLELCLPHAAAMASVFEPRGWLWNISCR
jgi:hypothetical protein